MKGHVSADPSFLAVLSCPHTFGGAVTIFAQNTPVYLNGEGLEIGDAVNNNEDFSEPDGALELDPKFLQNMDTILSKSSLNFDQEGQILSRLSGLSIAAPAHESTPIFSPTNASPAPACRPTGATRNDRKIVKQLSGISTSSIGSDISTGWCHTVYRAAFCYTNCVVLLTVVVKSSYPLLICFVFFRLGFRDGSLQRCLYERLPR